VTFIVETENLYKTFGVTKAADNISLQIPEQSIYGLLGPNGAGKTTLIRMITTITRPDSGSIKFRGQKLHEEHALQMGYMPEERGLYKKMSVLDQMLFFAEIKGMKRSDARVEAVKWLTRLDMKTWAGKKLEELSKGMAQKVQFLCTIVHRPEFIILDEPFSGFDPVNADLIKDLILELHSNGATILFSTHRMDNVEELCEYLCIINHGKMVLNGESGNIRRRMFHNQYEAGYLEEKNFDTDANKPVQSIKTQDGRFIYTFALPESANREALLQHCVSKGGLVLFSEDLPTIHQIFVDTVKN
jgi:ABC-2 type transport system ATP-binding protein